MRPTMSAPTSGKRNDVPYPATDASGMSTSVARSPAYLMMRETKKSCITTPMPLMKAK